ncbi:hypothetical protein [Polyangium fumosum]|uniref:Uncharacterized protein n=1 Tax=Polyangium fumosum TaxID=889272 RepID=A0A4U1JCJ4_9BACT|nr:hypothetical protein [Polyangium fumosum]TKD08360.1 hypothetical protein E8A74_15670 [Polyangium fumosum]
MKHALLCASAALVLLAACRGEGERPAPAGASSAAPPPRPDQLAPGELAEGTVDAFGLKLPRAMTVTAQFPDAFFARGSLRAEDVATYVKERVVSARVESAAPKTVFHGATAKSAPAPARVLDIEILVRDDHTEIVVRDVTRPPAKDGMTEEERWRELGLTPQGQPLDPTKLE